MRKGQTIGTQPTSLERRQRIYNWMEEPRDTRMSQTGLRKQLHLSYQRFAQIMRDWRAEKLLNTNREEKEAKIRDIMGRALAGGELEVEKNERRIIEGNEEFLDDVYNQPEEMKRRIVLALFKKAVQDKDHNAAHRIAQIMGWIIEKSEVGVTIGLSADERAKREAEAERRAREYREGQGYRVENLPTRPDLLHNEIRQD